MSNNTKEDAEIKNEQRIFFNDYAKKYDVENVETPYRYALNSKTIQKWKYEISQNSTVLDIGCGTGHCITPLIQHGAKVLALDISKEMLGKARATTHHLSENLSFIISDAEKLPLKDSSFDVCISLGTLHHLPNPVECIKEISRVLKSEGHFYGSEPNKTFFRSIYEKLEFLHAWKTPKFHLVFSRANLEFLFKKAGIQIELETTTYLPPILFNKLFSWNQRMGSIVLRSVDYLFERIPFLRGNGGIILILGKKI